MTRVTVITPAYNSEKYLEETIKSVLAQTMSDFEYIIVDDGSTDQTPAILAEFANHDSRIRIVTLTTSSGGPSVPKNIALSLAKSPYVAFIDHDDYFANDKLMKMCDGLDRNPEWVAAFHDLQLVDSVGVPHVGTYLSNASFKSVAANYINSTRDNWFECAPNFYQFMCLKFAAIHTATVVLAPARLFNDPVSFRSQFRGSDDTDLWFRIGLQGKMGFLDETLSYYRIHGNNLSADVVTMTANAVEVHEANFVRVRKFFSHKQVGQYHRKLQMYRAAQGYHLCLNRKYSEAIYVYHDIFRNGGYLEAIKGLTKIFIRKKFLS